MVVELSVESPDFTVVRSSLIPDGPCHCKQPRIKVVDFWEDARNWVQVEWVSYQASERWKRSKPWWVNSVWRGVWCISATLYLIPASKVSLKDVSVWYERTVTHVVHFICPLLQPFFQDDIAIGCSVQFLHGQTITWTASLFHFCMFHLSPA